MYKALKLSPLLLAVVLFGCTEPGGNNPGGTDGGTDGGPPVAPPPPTNEDGLPPSGSFGVSTTQDGTFLSDADGNITDPSDPNVINVAAGGTFYAQVAYNDPGGISDISIRIANSSPDGLGAALVENQSVGGFTLGAEVTGCTLDGTQTSVTCVYPIAVDDETENIDELDGAEGEFAYVFRTNVTDAADNTSDTPPRGYVTVGGSDGGTTGGTTTGGTTTGGTTGTTTTGGTDDGDTDDGDTDDGTTTGVPTTTGGTTTTPTTTGGTTGTPTTTGGTTGTTTTGGTDDGDTDDGDTDDGTTTGVPTTTGATTVTPTTTGGTDDGGTDDGDL